MLKRTIYPKTKRLSINPTQIEITEKLHGENLGIFKLDGELIIAQRNTLYFWDTIKDYGRQGIYKGLFGWLTDNAEEIATRLYEGSGVIGEWNLRGSMGYKFKEKFRVYAKARIEGDSLSNYELTNIIYTQDLIPWAFEDRIIPTCIGLAPLVRVQTDIPTKESLDVLYEAYTQSVDRKVEGFIVNYNENVEKYVRFKNNKLTEHVEGININDYILG